MTNLSASLAFPLLLVILCGAGGALLGSVATRLERPIEGERSVHPYIGFIVGAVLGVVAATLWRL